MQRAGSRRDRRDRRDSTHCKRPAEGRKAQGKRGPLDKALQDRESRRGTQGRERLEPQEGRKELGSQAQDKGLMEDIGLRAPRPQQVRRLLHATTDARLSTPHRAR